MGSLFSDSLAKQHLADKQLFNELKFEEGNTLK
jgi:hypothetical protein